MARPTVDPEHSKEAGAFRVGMTRTDRDLVDKAVELEGGTRSALAREAILSHVSRLLAVADTPFRRRPVQQHVLRRAVLRTMLARCHSAALQDPDGLPLISKEMARLSGMFFLDSASDMLLWEMLREAYALGRGSAPG